MKSYVRISVLNWTDVLTKYAIWVMVTYLTNVWGVNIRKAVGIVNIWTGTENVMQLFLAILSSEISGKYFMILLSSIAYSIGLGFLWMSTPPVLSNSIGNCTEYKAECIGETQKVLFYISLALIAIGISGHAVSINSFLKENTEAGMGFSKILFLFPVMSGLHIVRNCMDDEEKDSRKKRVMWYIIGILGMVLPVVAGITLLYIHAWSIRFGIPALCTLLATFLFITGSHSYRTWCLPTPEGSPVTAVFRVFVASTYKIFRRLPEDVSKNNGYSSKLRFLDKAGIILPNKPDQEKNKWTFCNVEEIEAAKKMVRIAPICLTFVICGVVLSIENTYFIEQANHLNRKVGRLTVPLSLFLAFYEFAKIFPSELYSSFVLQKDALKNLPEPEKKKREREIGINAPIIATFCVYIYIELSCITAAKVEQRRLHIVRKHDLLDKPEDRIPMSIFWLLPQFLLIASADGLYKSSVTHFFACHAPWSMNEYRAFFHKAVRGLGTIVSILCVYIVGKVSEMGGKPNWFQYTLNRSRLDRYYWTLSVLCAANVALYSLIICFYDRKRLLSEELTEEITVDLEEEG